MTSDERSPRPITFHESAGAVVVEGDRCLVLHRPDRDEWVLPKGHLERGERPEDAAVREVREETGLEVEIVRSLGNSRYAFGADAANRKRVDWFLARRVGGEIRLEAIFDEAAMLDAETAATTLTHEADREMARRALVGDDEG